MLSGFIRVGYAKGLYVPNALTPDANYGVIKEFLPAGKSLASYKLQIFDTWGNLIWETNSLDENVSPNIGWKGINYKGIPVPQEYMYGKWQNLPMEVRKGIDEIEK